MVTLALSVRVASEPAKAPSCLVKVPMIAMTEFLSLEAAPCGLDSEPIGPAGRRGSTTRQGVRNLAAQRSRGMAPFPEMGARGRFLLSDGPRRGEGPRARFRAWRGCTGVWRFHREG